MIGALEYTLYAHNKSENKEIKKPLINKEVYEQALSVLVKGEA